jgi:predicted transcriptional regulator
MDINDEIIEAQKFYTLLSDESYLLNIDIEKETYKAVCKSFLNGPCSKSDFLVLIHLMEEYLHWPTQLFSFKYEYLELKLGVKKSSVSRSIKNLIESGFINKAPTDNAKIKHYFFRAQYEVMKERV